MKSARLIFNGHYNVYKNDLQHCTLTKYTCVIVYSFVFFAEYKECFSLYDRSRRGVIRGEDLIVVMRSLGTYPTVEEIKEYRKQYDHGE